MGKRRKQDEPDYVDPKKMIALEEEMAALKKEYGIEDKPRWWVRIGDFIANHAGTRQPVPVFRKKYLLLALCLGWAGGHRFYTKQYALGVIYLLFCWTGIPFAMTLIDLMIALPMKADEQGRMLL